MLGSIMRTKFRFSTTNFQQLARTTYLSSLVSKTFSGVQGPLTQASLDAFQAEFHQGSLDARAAATTQIQGIAGLKTGQQQFRKAAAVGHERIADLQAVVQDTRAMADDRSHQANTQSETFMTEVRRGIFEATNSESAQIEEVGCMKAEDMQKLDRISEQ